MPTCLATNEVTFAVNYVDGNGDAYPANSGSLAIYNGQAGGYNSGFGARALFGCAAMELALGGTAANAGDSGGQCIVQSVGHKHEQTHYKNGGLSIIGPSAKLLHASSDHTMPWATISSVASAQVTNGYTITFTMKFVPNTLAAATTKTEAEIATAVNAITALNFKDALSSVVTNGAQMMTVVGLQWPCFGSALTYGCGRVRATTLLSDNNGIYNGPDPAANSVAAADFTFASTILASQSAICYPAATPGVGNLPTSVTNGLLNSCGQAMPPGASCTYNCSNGSTAATSYAFECSASGTSAYLTPNAGNMTCTSPTSTSNSSATPASNSSATPASNSSGAATPTVHTGTYWNVASTITFPGYIVVADTQEKFGKLVGCAFAKCISDAASRATPLCTATPGPTFTYMSGASSTNTVAAVARRAGATVATNLKVYESTFAKTDAETAGTQAFSSVATLNTMITLMNGESDAGFSAAALTASNISPLAWTTSSAAVVLPSMMAMFSAALLVLMQ